MVEVMRRFAFVDRWQLPVGPSEVFRVLEDIDRYPTWWPQVRSVRREDETRGSVVVRSRLPMNLHLRLTSTTADAALRVLRVGVSGDLLGWAQWLVTPSDGGSAALFTQEVELARRSYRLTASAAPVLGRYLLVRNHQHMMRAGREGLIRHLRVQADAAP